MKNLVLLFFFLINSLSLNGQYGNFTAHQIDSLTQLFAQMESDTAIIDHHHRLARLTYKDLNLAEYHFNEALRLAKKIDDKPRIILGLLSFGYHYTRIGELTKSINLEQEALRLTEEMKGDISMALTFLAMNYEAQGDYVSAIDYTRRGFLISEKRLKNKLPDQTNYTGAAMRMGQIFEKLGALDSAMYYAQLAYQRISEKPINESMVFFYCQTCNLLGTLHNRLNHPKEAIRFYHLALDKAIASDLTPSQEPMKESQLGLARFYAKTNEPDSVIYYAMQAYETAKKINAFLVVETAAELMRTAYEKKGQYAKALYFSDRAIAAKDSVSGAEKVREVMNLTYKEESRQQKIEQETAATQASYESKIKVYALLAVLGGLFLVATLLYRNNRQKQHINSLLETKNTQIEKEKARAEESERFKAHFLATMSHEIRTPMNAISGMSELLYDTALDQRQRRYVEGICTSSDNLLVIINDILDFSKLEAGRMLLENAPFRPKNLLHQIEQTLRFRAEQKGLIFTTEIPPSRLSRDVPSVPDILLGDLARLQQVLLNLAGNAIKFTEKGSITVRISPLTTENKGKNTYRFEVMDTGIGIAPEQQTTIFEQFQQADTSISRRYGGTGLGLTISRQILKLYNTELHLTSKMGVGSTFFFDLVLDEPMSETLALVPKHIASDDYESLKGLHILIAEDNVYNQLVITESLEKWMPDVVLTLVENGQQVLDQLYKNDFDLILMDIQMPQLDGYETTRHIRQHFTDAKKRNIPIIALTASVTQEETAESYDAGMNAVVRKPFKIKDLLREIGYVLGKSPQPPKGEYEMPPSVSQTFDELSDSPSGGWGDFTFLHKFTDGDMEVMQHWKDRFRDTAPLSIAQLSAAITDNKTVDFCKTAHAFRPQLDMMGLRESSCLLLLMEEKATQSGDCKEIMSCFTAFQLDVKRILDGLE